MVSRRAAGLRLLAALLCFSPAAGRLFGFGGAHAPAPAPGALLDTIAPTVVGASHNVTGHAPERAADGDESTFWMVPGGQRMEFMSRDKWIVFDVGEPRSPSAVSLLGVVDSFGPARVLLDAGASPSGPWRRVAGFRAFGVPMRWQRVGLPPDGEPSRFYRLYVRREGHATFKHALHGVLFHAVGEGEAAPARA